MRHLTRALDTAIQNRREIALDTLLTKAWDEFTTALQSGEVKEIEERYATFASEIVADIVQEVEFSGAALEDG